MYLDEKLDRISTPAFVPYLWSVFRCALSVTKILPSTTCRMTSMHDPVSTSTVVMVESPSETHLRTTHFN